MKPAEVSTPSDREVLIKRSFDAPVNLVWQANGYARMVDAGMRDDYSSGGEISLALAKR
jgi:hypothetical protein